MDKINVLFLCTANSARSQMAEAFLRKYTGDKYEAFSAGLEPKGIHPFTIKVMQELGISLEGHRSKSFSEYMGKVRFAYLITVCAEAEKKCPKAFPGVAHRLHWPFDYPSAVPGSDEVELQKFREVQDQIKQRLKEWLSDKSI